jgi:hypothetical protein
VDSYPSGLSIVRDADQGTIVDFRLVHNDLRCCGDETFNKTTASTEACCANNNRGRDICVSSDSADWCTGGTDKSSFNSDFRAKKYDTVTERCCERNGTTAENPETSSRDAVEDSMKYQELVRVGSGDECCGVRGVMDQDQYPYWRSGADMQFCIAPGVLTKKAGAALETEFWGYRLSLDRNSVHAGEFAPGGSTFDDYRVCVHNTTDLYKFGGDMGLAVSYVAKHQFVLDASANLKCCSNGTAGDPTGTTIQFATDVVEANAVCCGQLIMHDTNDHCCSLRAQTDFTDGLTAPSSTISLTENLGEITKYRTISPKERWNTTERQYCCGDSSDFAPALHERCAAFTNAQTAVYDVNTEVVCPSNGNTLVRANGDACCGNDRLDQYPYQSGTQYCCNGVLSKAVTAATTVDRFWGYRMDRSDSSRDTTDSWPQLTVTGESWGANRSAAAHRERMCVLNNTDASWFHTTGDLAGGGVHMADDQIYDVKMGRWDAGLTSHSAYSKHKCVLGGSDLKCCSNGTLPEHATQQAEVWASDTVANP